MRRRCLVGRNHGRLLFSTLLLSYVLSTGAVSAGSSSPSPQAGELLLRLLQYEAMLGDELTPEMALCVDMVTRGRFFEFAPDGGPPGASAINSVRRAAELCAISPAYGATRLVGELRELLAKQLAQATKLNAVRQCLSQSVGTEALRTCVTTATGAPPTPTEWRQWTTLFQQRGLR